MPQTDRSDRKTHILLLYAQMIPSIRLCGHLQLTALAEQGKIEYRFRSEQALTNDDIQWADVVLLGRLDSWFSLQIGRKMKACGKKLLYILDDDLLCVPEGLNSSSHYRSKHISKQLRELLSMSDGLISPSPILLQKYTLAGGAAILIEEPVVDPAPFAPHDAAQPVKIGFAASIDRTGDLEAILSSVLHTLHHKYGARVQFEFFGAIPSFAADLNARALPFCNSYDSYRQTLNGLQWDIGLAPMPYTPFHACKHYNKFVEYAAAGIVGVFSNVQPYVRLKEKTTAAVLCENTQEDWLHALCDLIDHTEKREALRQQAHAYATSEMSVARSAKQLLSQLPLHFRAPAIKHFIPVRLYACLYLPIRILQLFSRYGLRTPLFILRRLAARLKK